MRKHRILVVEDEAIIGMHISSTLGQFGYDVVGVAASAEEAISMAGEIGPDLLLMDIVMPGGMDGIDAARILKDTLGLPVVYLTGNADVSTVTRARETNPYGYVLKPVNPQDLFSTIDTALHRHELEKKLRDNEEKLRRLTDSMTDMVGQVDRDNRIIYASPSHKKIAGYDPEELIGQNPMMVVHPDDQEKLRKAYLKGIADHVDTRTEYRGLHRDGHYLWVETVNSFLYTPEGGYDGAVFSTRDISERKRVEALHRESEERYKALFSRSHDCIYIHDFAGNFLEANDSALDLLGYTRGEIQSLSFQSLLLEDEFPLALEALKEILAAGYQKEKRRYRIRAKGGGLKYIEALGMMVYRDGKPDAILGIAHDITEQEQSAIALRESEAKYRLITDMMSDVVWTLDMDLAFTYVSPSIDRVLGYSPDWALGKSVSLFVPADIYSLVRSRLVDEIRSEEVGNPDPDRIVVLEIPAMHKNSSTVWLETVVKAIRGGDGTFIGLHGVSRDISERKRMSDSLTESEEKYRALVESTDTGYVIVDSGGAVMDANREYVRLTGHGDISDILGRNVIEWTAAHDRDRNAAAVRQCFRDGFIRGLEIDYVDGAGNITPIEINATVAGTGPGVRIHTLCRDISGRRKAEEAMLKSEERFRGIALSISDWIWEIDENMVCTYVSDRVTEIMGYTREELLGRSPFDIIPPDEKEQLKPDTIDIIGQHRPFRDFEIWNIAKDGRRVCIVSSGVPMFDRDGTFRGFRGVNRDITGRKRMEALLKEKEEQFRALFELSSAGIFIYDLNMSVTDCNRQFADILKTKRELLIGLNLNLLREPDIVRGLVDALNGTMTTYKGPYRATTTGAVPWISSSVSPLRGPGGEIVGGLGIVVDITDMVMAGEAAREREELYRAVFDQSPVGIFTFDSDMVLTSSNARFAAILDSSIEKLVGLNLSRLRDRAVIPALEEAIRGNVAHYEGPYHATTSEAFRWVRFNVSPLRGPDGAVVAGIGVVVDVTDHKIAEEALSESRERYRDLFDNANDIIYNVDFNERFISFNKKALEVTGYTAEEAGRLTVSDIVAPEYLDLVREMMKKKLMGGAPTTYDVEIFARDGRRLQLEINTQLIMEKGKPVSLQGIGRDITERKLMEDRIRASLKEKEMLLREVHHRVKNNFQVITSLMSLQSAGIQNPELRKSFMDAQSRIRSMSLIHEQFYQSDDLSRLDFASYVNTIVNELHYSFADSRKIEPLVVVGGIRLNVDQAIPCGLIINELLTNSFKYAFPEGREGAAEILVSIRETGGRIEMVIGDNGAGLPDSVDLDSTRTLGLSLVSLLVKQLDGTLVLERSPGTRYIISFPVK